MKTLTQNQKLNVIQKTKKRKYNKLTPISIFFILISFNLFAQKQNWSQIEANIRENASDMDINKDGSVLIIGEQFWGDNSEGRAIIYKNITGKWKQLGNTIIGKSEGLSGEHVSINNDGTKVAIATRAFINKGHNNSDWYRVVNVYELIRDKWIKLPTALQTKIGSTYSIASIKLNAQGNELTTILWDWNDKTNDKKIVRTYKSNSWLTLNSSTLNTHKSLTTNDKLLINKYNDSSIKIKMLNVNTITEFKAYNILGKLIMDEKPNKANFILKIPEIKQGNILFIKAKLKNGKIVYNKFVKS